MAIRKYARLLVLDAWQVPAQAEGLQKYAHRVDFDYTPRPGFLYVRSRAISSRANDNHDEFPADEIVKAYRTFLGKPCFVNHHNANHRRARGVIVAVALHRDRAPDGRPDTWAECLMEIDAVRYPKLAKAIIEGRVNRTSMGVDVEESECTACGNKASDPAQYCQHLPAMKGRKIRRRDPKTGKLKEEIIREICRGLSFFENSLLIEEPADPTAYVLGTPDARGLKMAASRHAALGPEWNMDEVANHLKNAHGLSDEELHQHLSQATFRSQGWDFRSIPRFFHGVHRDRHSGDMVNEVVNDRGERHRHLPDSSLSWPPSDSQAMKERHPADIVHEPTPHHFHPERTDEYPNRQTWNEGDNPGEWSNLGSCTRTYTSDQKHRAFQRSRGGPKPPEKEAPREEWSAFYEADRAHHDRMKRNNVFCPGCGAYKWMHAETRPSEVGKTTPKAEPERRSEYETLMGNTLEYRPRKPQTWSSLHTADISDEDIRKGLNMPSVEQGRGEELHRSLHKMYEEMEGTDEERRSTHNLAAGQRLMETHGPAGHCPKGWPGCGRYGTDTEAEGSHEEPYYEVRHGSEWRIRDYGTGDLYVHHKGAPAMIDRIDVSHRGDSGERAPGAVTHERMHGELRNWANEYGEDAARSDPDIRRWRRMRGMASLQAEARGYETAADHPWFKANPVDHMHIVNAYHDSSADEKNQGHRWYNDAHHVAKAIAGGDAARGAGLLAAYSPRTAWPINMFNASKAHRENKAFGGPGEGAMGLHKNLATPILEGIHHTAAFKKSAPKIRAFAHLIEHGGDTDEETKSGTQKVVVDRHALSAAIGRRVSDDDLDAVSLDTDKYYNHVADAYHRAAAHLSGQLGYHVAPHQVQATVWIRQLRLNTAEDASSRGATGKGRVSRDKNAWARWKSHVQEHHNDVPEGNMHIGELMQRRAYGETKVPQQVNTLRQEECPVCNEAEVWTGQRCPVCGYVAPPDMFRDPDTEKAMQVREELAPEQDAMGAMPGNEIPPAGQGSWPSADEQLFHPDQIAPNGVPAVGLEGEQEGETQLGQDGEELIDSDGDGIPDEEDPDLEGDEDLENELADEDEEDLDEDGIPDSDEEAELADEEDVADEDEDAELDDDEDEDDGDDERQERPEALARR